MAHSKLLISVNYFLLSVNTIADNRYVVIQIKKKKAASETKGTNNPWAEKAKWKIETELYIKIVKNRLNR